MRFLGLEIKRVRRYEPLYHRQGVRTEPRTRSATKKFTFGNVQGSIYSPFDEETGETQWRFSLIKLSGKNEDGEQAYRRSFDAKDLQDLHYTVNRCVDYMLRADEL